MLLPPFLIQIDLQREMSELIPLASLYVIDSPHGHDAFLLEIQQLNNVVAEWLRGTT